MAETLEETIIRTWKSDPKLQQEFMGDMQAYDAYSRANAAGLIQIYGKSNAV